MRGVEVNSGTCGSYEIARFAPKNKNHTLVKGRTFPEKLLEADVRQKPNDPAVRMVVTETKLNDMKQNKPSLKADILQEAVVEDQKQQLIIRESSGEEKRMSAEELIKQPGDATLALKIEPDLQIHAAGGNSNFTMPPYKYNSNKVLGTVSFFIFDHLNTSRIVYKPNVNCNGGAVSFSLENVVDYYPYGKVLREYSSGKQEKYLTTGNERDIETGWDFRNMRSSDADVGRFLQVDPLREKTPSWTPYRYGFCSPVRYSDPSGMTEKERQAALAKAKEFTAKSTGKSDSYGGKGTKPGDPVDCSGLISAVVKAAGLDNPNRGSSNGVTNIVSNSTKIDFNNIVEGSIVTFNNNKHIGIVSGSIEKDENGNVISFNVIGSQTSTGPQEFNVRTDKSSDWTKENSKGEKNNGYWSPLLGGVYKWDTPDETNSSKGESTSNTENNNSQQPATNNQPYTAPAVSTEVVKPLIKSN